jgi:2-polyprenyl-3-methyl-5-hydroxy-6-metoxy-1,4-benzoquinol methylase
VAAEVGVVGAPRCLASGSVSSEAWADVWDAEYLTTTDHFLQRRCLECGALFIDPVPANRLAEIYPPNYYSFSRLGRPGFVQRIKFALDRRLFGKTLRQLPATQLSVLDVGGGAGSQLDTVRTCDARVRFTQVVDLDVRAAEVARANGHAFFCGRIEDFEADRTFDLILLLNLIEHVQSPLAVLEKLRSMLKPEGAILVKTPNYDSLDARLFRHRNWGGYHAPRHWVLFTRESFEVLARRAGLRVRSFSYTQGAPFWSTSILFMLAHWGLIRVTKERPAVFHPLFPVFAAVAAGFDFLRSPFAKLSQMLIVLRRDDAG